MEVNFLSKLIRRVSTKPTTNGEIKPFIYNRNPRNLERLRLERKPKGFELEKNIYYYWHILNVVKQPRYVVANLIHNNKKVVVSASTNEWCIKKFLYSTTDKMAYITLAKVFAERCQECGITSFKCPYEVDNEEQVKMNLFLNTLKSENIVLEEASEYDIHNIWFKNREKKPWTVLED